MGADEMLVITLQLLYTFRFNYFSYCMADIKSYILSFNLDVMQSFIKQQLGLFTSPCKYLRFFMTDLF